MKREYKTICKNCGKEFIANTYGKYYCDDCDKEINWNKCIICGKPVRKKVCCSPECLSIHRSKNNPSKRPEVREKLKETGIRGIEAAKKTNLEKYGVEFPFQNKEVQEKCRETQIKNHDGKLAWNDRDYKKNNIDTNNINNVKAKAKVRVKFGYLRETQEIAEKSGLDNETKLNRTGLEEYLKVIFPNINDWVHDKPLPIIIEGKQCRKRPDYRSEELKIIIEMDGLPHYQNPDIIIKDEENIKFYENLGYKVIRIPYFIQLTNEVVNKMFNVNIEEELFNKNYPSLSLKCRNTPSYLCPLGINRMAKEFIKYKQQYEINSNFLKQFDDTLTGLSLLENEMNKIL